MQRMLYTYYHITPQAVTKTATVHYELWWFPEIQLNHQPIYQPLLCMPSQRTMYNSYQCVSGCVAQMESSSWENVHHEETPVTGLIQKHVYV